MNFADRLHSKIKKNKSVIVAGLDPRPDKFPAFVLEEAARKSSAKEEELYEAFKTLYGSSLETLQDSIAAIKPNIAFFEQYGVAGIRAFSWVCKRAKELDILVIADAKRGDIGSTAEAYSAAFLGQSTFSGTTETTYDADALTINPFLGFDTVETFLKDCLEYGKGIFVLVKTSNPGSSDIQNLKENGVSVSERIAEWLNQNSTQLKGECGYSGLGAVVGATYPEEARHLRSLMPGNYFLIPGYGAQGGTARDAVAGFSTDGGAAVINISRALFTPSADEKGTKEDFLLGLKSRVDTFNADINSALEND